MTVKGTEAFNNKWEGKAEKLINKSTFASVLDGFYNYTLINRSYTSAYYYAYYADKFLKTMKVTNLNQITMNMYTKYLVKMKGKTASYQIAVYSGLKAFSKYLKANGICEDDYMSYIDRPKFKETQETKDRREKGYLNKDEISLLINFYGTTKWEDIRNRAIIFVFLNTGIRASALYKLDVDSVNFKAKTISVLEKGGVSRKIYLSDVTIEVLKAWMDARKEYADKEETALFISKTNGRIDYSSIYLVIKNAEEYIGHELSPHKLRATFGTQLYEATQNVYFVQHRMGHASPQTTEKYIRGQKEEEARKAADLMGDLLQ